MGVSLCTILMYNAFPWEGKGHGGCGNCPAREGGWAQMTWLIVKGKNVDNKYRRNRGIRDG